jgi:lactoylglutathione lyase
VCFTVSDLDAVYSRLISLGGEGRMAPHPSPRPEIRMAYIADPEGNLVELFSRAPSSN